MFIILYTTLFAKTVSIILKTGSKQCKQISLGSIVKLYRRHDYLNFSRLFCSICMKCNHRSIVINVRIDDDTSTTPSPCLIMRNEILSKKLIGSFAPRCTKDGHFEPVQCHGSTGECWCVEMHGNEVPLSRRRPPAAPDCSRLGMSVRLLSRSVFIELSFLKNVK